MQRIFFGVAAITLLSACAAKPSYQIERVKKPKPQYELVTIEQQAKEAIVGTPTEFRLSLSDDIAAWARVELFFKQYTKSGYSGVESLPGGGLLVSNKSSAKDAYSYSVEKYPTATKATYLVECRANTQLGGQPRYCKSNAQNLARFIREGQLELSMLAR